MKLKKGLLGIVLIVALFSSSISAFATTHNRSNQLAIRVGYWEGSNAIKYDEFGTAYGAAVDYFAELTKYTGDQYEFVPCDLDDIEDMLNSGEIDIFGPTVQSRYDGEDYIYCIHEMGYEWIYLAALSTDTITYDEYDAISERIIGVQEGTKQKDFLYDYMEEHDIDAEISLIDAGSDILVDNTTIVLTSSLRIKDGYKVIANLGLDKLYYMTIPENQNIMDEIDAAMDEIDKADPIFYDTLYTTYFSNIPIAKPTLTAEDYAILDQQLYYTVGFDPNHSPFSYYDEQGNLTGIAISIIEELAQDGQFEIEYVPLVEGEYTDEMIDINISLLEDTAFIGNYTYSAPYLYYDLMLVGPSEFNGYNHKTIVSLNYVNITEEEISNYYPGATWITCENVTQIKEMLKSGEADYAFSTSVTAIDILNDLEGEDFSISPMGYVLNVPLTFAMDTSEEFIEVFNKLIERFDNETFESITIDAAFQVSKAKSLSEYITIYKDEIIIVVLCIISGVSGLTFLLGGNRRKLLEKSLNIDSITELATEHKFVEDVRFMIDKDLVKKFSIIVIDIDNFKYINETFGYQIGTQVLKAFSQYLQQFFKNYLVMARTGGDNFSILIETLGVEEKIIAAIEEDSGIWGQLRKLLGEDFTFNVSIGMYDITDRALEINYMLDCANIAKDKGKEMYGRTFVKFSHQMEEERETNNFVTAQMEKGIAEREFIMMYQPKIELKTTTITGAEALVRWKQSGQFISPGDFIPLFEKNGFILKLDYYVVNAVCEYMREQKKLGVKLPVISINLSGHTVLDRKLINNLANILKRHEIEPKEIDLEITESAMVDNFEKVLLKIKQLKGLGFTISMDDFGTGVSTLNRLKDIPIDILKLDQGFIRHILEDEKGAIIVKNIIQMADELHLETVGEGIETKEHLDLLMELGCDVGQGYYFAKPLSSEQFTELLT